MRIVFSRIIIISCLLAYLSTLGIIAAGKWYENHPTSENLSAGIRVNPQNPQLWTSYGRHLLVNRSAAESSRAVEHFKHALKLNVFDSVSWDGLIDAQQQTDTADVAASSLTAWLKVEPIYPEASWRLGSFQVFSGNIEEAFDHLMSAAKADKRLWVPMFDLAWKVNPDANLILQSLVPDTNDANEGYFQFLLGSNRLTEARPVWTRVRARKNRRAIDWGTIYVTSLVDARMAKEATEVWNEVLNDSDRAVAKPAGDLLTNGDFEAEMPNAGLDWRLYLVPGYQINLDDTTSKTGLRSLRVSFDGSVNSDFVGVAQYVPVRPNRSYRFRAFLKLEGITTESGVRLFVQSVDGPPDQSFSKSAENLIGTLPWTEQSLDFRTGSETSWVIVVLKRFPSTQIQNNKIRGTVWIDNASVKPLETNSQSF